MNNQEAIKMLTAKVECMRRETSGIDINCNSNNCDNCELCYEQGIMSEQQEALTIAIKALKAEPCEDAISRQAAIDVIEAGRLTKLIDAETAVNGLKALPSAQPTQKKGKWIYPYETTRLISICSECGAHGRGNFCSNCGADMRG